MMKYIFCGLFGFTVMFAVASIDSESWWPIVLLAISGLCLSVISWRCGWMYDPEMEEEE